MKTKVPLLILFVLVFSTNSSFSQSNLNEANKEGTIQNKFSEIPIGTILAFAGNAIPSGYLMCDGQEYLKAEYEDLNKVIGTFWGRSSNEANKFKVPDLRGYFLRGVDGDANRDPDKGDRTNLNGENYANQIGSYQEDEFKGHSHDSNMGQTARVDNIGGNGKSCESVGNIPGSNHPVGFATINNPSGKETRPKNAYVNFIIKAR